MVVQLSGPDYDAVVRTLRLRDVTNEAIACSDAGEALRYLFETPEASMPAMVVMHASAAIDERTELLRAIKRDRQLRVTPVLVVAGAENSDAEIAECYRAGANTCLRRSDDDATYDDALFAMTTYWLKTAVLPITALAL